jgi:predicted HTH transcriptional regulator
MLFRGKKIAEYSSIDTVLNRKKVQESRILDYKRECKLALEQDKSEFIYDVCSFYNSEGGCIIYGLEEEKRPTRKKYRATKAANR